jgi:hypothetical protein
MMGGRGEGAHTHAVQGEPESVPRSVRGCCSHSFYMIRLGAQAQCRYRRALMGLGTFMQQGKHFQSVNKLLPLGENLQRDQQFSSGVSI